MKLLILFSLFFLHILPCTGQQAISLKLEKKIWDYERKNFYIQKLHPEEKNISTDSAIILKNKDRVNQNAVFHIVIQQKTDKNKGCFLNVLAGSNQNQQIVIVVDKNGNNNFCDDTVYAISMKNRVTSFKDFFQRIPSIAIDSLQIYNKENKVEYKSIALKIGISNTKSDYFESFEQVKEATFFLLDIFATTYYSASIRRANELYEFAVVQNPCTQNLLAYPEINDKGSVIFYYKKLATKDSAVNFLPIGLLNTSNTILKNAFAIGKDTFKISAVSILQKKINLVKDFHVNLQAFQLGEDNAYHELAEILTDTAYTLLDFSGSWCKPCQIILPKLKALYRKYTGKVKFITVAIENDSLTALKYHDQSGIQWKMIYENINCTDKRCLKNILQVNGYPTLILFDKNKKIVFQDVGTEAVQALQQLLEKSIF